MTPPLPFPSDPRQEDVLAQVQQALRQIRSQERVCVFIDNSNLFHALKSLDLGTGRLDYIKLRDYLSDGRSTTIRFYYSVPPQSSVNSADDRRRQDKRNKFYDFLGENLGYTMVELPLRERTVIVDGVSQQVSVEKGLDCEIVYDMAVLSRTGRYNTFILVAGDEDYSRTVKRVRNETGVNVEVAFFTQAGCSAVLIHEATKFIDLSFVKDELFRDQRVNDVPPY